MTLITRGALGVVTLLKTSLVQWLGHIMRGLEWKVLTGLSHSYH